MEYICTKLSAAIKYCCTGNITLRCNTHLGTRRTIMPRLERAIDKAGEQTHKQSSKQTNCAIKVLFDFKDHDNACENQHFTFCADWHQLAFRKGQNMANSALACYNWVVKQMQDTTKKRRKQRHNQLHEFTQGIAILFYHQWSRLGSRANKWNGRGWGWETNKRKAVPITNA